MDTSTITPLTGNTITYWKRELIQVWHPTRICNTLPYGNGGVMFIAQLEHGHKLHLGIDSEGIRLCGVWQGEECVLWERHLGFRTTSGLIPAPVEEEPALFERFTRFLIEQNCHSMGMNLQKSPVTLHDCPRVRALEVAGV